MVNPASRSVSEGFSCSSPRSAWAIRTRLPVRPSAIGTARSTASSADAQTRYTRTGTWGCVWVAVSLPESVHGTRDGAGPASTGTVVVLIPHPATTAANATAPAAAATTLRIRSPAESRPAVLVPMPVPVLVLVPALVPAPLGMVLPLTERRPPLPARRPAPGRPGRGRPQ